METKATPVVVTTKTVSKTQFTLKKTGANVLAMFSTEEDQVEPERFSKRVTQEEYAVIKTKVERYNKRPSDKAKQAIIALLTPETIKAKKEVEAKKAKVKGLKQQVKKIAKENKKEVSEKRNILEELELLLGTDDTALEKMQTLLNKFKKVEEEAPVAATTLEPRSGEGYRK